MQRYSVRIIVCGQLVWGDNDIMAASAADAKAIAEKAFLSPLPPEAYEGLSPDMADLVRKCEERSAGFRQYHRIIEARVSRAH